MDGKSVAKIVQGANRSEISRKTGIHLSHISRVLSGKRRPSGTNLAEISKALDITMDDLHACLVTLRNRAARSVAAA